MRILLLALLAAAAPAAAQGPAAPAASIAECDRLAANPADRTRPAGIAGVNNTLIDARSAVPACEAATRAAPNDPRISYQLGRAYGQAKLFDKARAAYERADRAGFALATNNLAIMLRNGQGGAQDLGGALRLFEKAARAGLGLAMRNLAGNWESGTLGRVDETQARIWYQAAAEAGDTIAMQKRADFSVLGRGGAAVDEADARRWYDRASAAGNAAAKQVLAQLRTLEAMETEQLANVTKRLVDAGCYAGGGGGRGELRLALAQKSCPDQDPVLRIETGMHTGIVKRIGVDASCRLAVTGADDKTVRLWSLPEGRLIRTQRLPIGDGAGGRTSAVAVSPDGRLIAAAGYDARFAKDGTMGVYLFDAATGQSVRRIGSFEAIVTRLAFSAQGTQLAVALGDFGVRLLDVASGRQVAADTDFSDQSYDIAYGPDGALYSGGWDGFVRRYGPDGRRTHKTAVAGGKHPFGLAISPDGRRLAVGFEDSKAVELFETATLTRIGEADTKDATGGTLMAVTWSADGRRLLAGGQMSRLYDGVTRRFIRIFGPGGGRLGTDLPIAENTVFDMKPCGDSIAFVTADPSFGLLRPDGTAVTLARGREPVMRTKLAENFTVAPDGLSLRFGLELGGATPVLFDLAAGTVTDAPGPVPGLQQAQITGLPVDGWRNTKLPTLKGKPLVLFSDETARSLAIRPDQSAFVLGADFKLRAYSAEGRELWPSQKLSPSGIWGVNLAAGGELVVAAYGDGTVRWHRWSDGQELLALFVDREDRRFVAWTPTGYYLASPGAEDLIGWHVNRGWEQPADFFPASRFRERFNRPDIVRLILATRDEGKAVAQANAASKRREETRSLVQALPPVVTILSPAAGARLNDESVEVTYTVRSPSGLPIDRVDAFVDGARIATRGFDRRPSDETRGTVRVPISAKDSEIALVARSGELSSDMARVKVAWAGGATTSGADLLKPALYGVVIGVSEYADPALKLGFAAKDARDFAAAFRAQSGGLYRSVDVEVLTDKDATALGVKQALSRLKRKMTNRDMAVVFLGGHGVTDPKGKFWFLTHEGDRDELLTTAVSRDDIMGVVSELPGKKMVFLDACHSGAALAEKTRSAGLVDINKALGDFALGDDGVIAFSSSTGREFSLELDSLGNGAFTRALIEGLADGKADLLRGGTITLSQLDAYVVNRVKEITKGRQPPMMLPPATIDYPIALPGRR